MTVSLKYARVERERRWLLGSTPELSGSPMEITDRYVLGTRLRLREAAVGEPVVHKLGHQVRLGSDPAEVACTSFYLDDAEWSAGSLPGSSWPRSTADPAPTVGPCPGSIPSPR